MKSPHKP